MPSPLVWKSPGGRNDFTTADNTVRAEGGQRLKARSQAAAKPGGEGNASPQTSLFQTLMSVLTTWQATQEVREEKSPLKKAA